MAFCEGLESNSGEAYECLSTSCRKDSVSPTSIGWAGQETQWELLFMLPEESRQGLQQSPHPWTWFFQLLCAWSLPAQLVADSSYSLHLRIHLSVALHPTCLMGLFLVPEAICHTRCQETRKLLPTGQGRRPPWQTSEHFQMVWY